MWNVLCNINNRIINISTVYFNENPILFLIIQPTSRLAKCVSSADRDDWWPFWYARVGPTACVGCTTAAPTRPLDGRVVQRGVCRRGVLYALSAW